MDGPSRVGIPLEESPPTPGPPRRFFSTAGQGTRAIVVAALVGLWFAVLGLADFSLLPSKLLERSSFHPDLALRALSRGWFAAGHTIPVTIVDIDEETYREWGSPPVTPRHRLRRILEVVTLAEPSAVVLDIDLSSGEGDSQAQAETDPGGEALRDFLATYRGAAPIVLAKRIEHGADGFARAAASSYDDTVLHNSKLAWAHAQLVSVNGVTRRWQEWTPVCSGNGPKLMPFMAVQLAAMLDPLPARLQRPAPPPLPTACITDEGEFGPSQRLLIGPRLTGERGQGQTPDARTVSARLLVDPDLDRDDASLFAKRVVLIGATHAASRDFWATPVGYFPGVEVLADIVRFSPVAKADPGSSAILAERVLALLLYAIFAYSSWTFRPMAALVLSGAATLAVLAVSTHWFGDLRAFDALETALLLLAVYLAIFESLHFAAEVRAHRDAHPMASQPTLRAILAVCLRKH